MSSPALFVCTLIVLTSVAATAACSKDPPDGGSAKPPAQTQSDAAGIAGPADAAPTPAGSCTPTPRIDTPCSAPGTHCPVPGLCDDACARCVVMVCTGGKWARVEELPERDCSN